VTPSLRTHAIVLALAFAASLGVVACDKGPAQKAGEKVDKALDTDKPIGAGPVEKAGKEIDNAAEKTKDAAKN
jgi:hypothetical protein